MGLWSLCGMTAQTAIKQFKAFPSKQRAEAAKFVIEPGDSWMPCSFAAKDLSAARRNRGEVGGLMMEEAEGQSGEWLSGQ